MNFNIITKNHNHDNGYIPLVNLLISNIPEKIKVQDFELLKKNEFHVSIMALKHLAPMLNPDNVEQASEQLKQDFLEFIKKHNMSNYNLTGEYRLVKRDERVTLVAMAKLENLDSFFEYLRSKHATDFPTQPAHITMYTLQPEAGIGILSDDELQRDSIIVSIPELAGMKVDYVKD
jgi:hypothetical protein